MESTGEKLNRVAASLIRERRLQLGLSQEDLAAAASLDRTYISAIERGRRNISLLAFGRLLDALDTDEKLLGKFLGID